MGKNSVPAAPRRLRCKRCGHRWTSVLARDPIVCPLCKNPNWNRRKWKRALRSA